MKKIIDGKLYDTDKARLLGTWISSVDGGSECTEALYRKRTGEYFLHGVGGTATRYAVSLGQNDWEPGSMIIPLPAAKAREWAREKLSADKYDHLPGARRDRKRNALPAASRGPDRPPSRRSFGRRHQPEGLR